MSNAIPKTGREQSREQEAAQAAAQQAQEKASGKQVARGPLQTDRGVTTLDDAVVVAEWGGGLVGQLVPQYLLVTIDREAAVREDPSSQARYISWRIVETSES
ncbi:MAG: hypothetical protein DI630_36100 [Gordonia sp. (in: high G+C Gram-positive bacteria)]|nr:MAG: hypothetical protein DI630_36100 [Gordonia sp. (in: high G+C Gram-positive bacteria)]